MATQFQHRLVGTVILVALGVIFLPDLLDGKQQLAPDEAVTIPLRPELEPARPVVTAPPAAEQLSAGEQERTGQSEPVAAKPEVWAMEQAKEAPPVAPKQVEQPVPPKPQPAPPAPKPAPPAPQPAPVVKPAPIIKPAPIVQPAPVIKQIAPQQVTPQQVAPQQGNHVVQLGAFRNAANVNALVNKLRAAGYRAQTTPAVPREGQLNRVWVGPDSKARLEQQLSALERLTGLKGSVRPQ
ncbi:cell division protein DedD [Oceanisphaera psychrotolerans]|uniref:DedD protein n=1 Tax=Oceanisphaera psychrotolerans TaxID=1414654 RepID=A0A1J4QIM5_9GAMM|nr:cell division protein DedD [Oceanisphaera psychrotolerans]OIN13158.1 DedD protein [Oceanisphaera psychrotolerans]